MLGLHELPRMSNAWSSEVSPSSATPPAPPPWPPAPPPWPLPPQPLPVAVPPTRNPRGFFKAGLIAGLLPFVVQLSSSRVVIENGVVDATYRDYVAITGGVIALLCGVFALAGARRAQVVGALVVLALGGLQLARGFGVGARPELPSSHTTRFDWKSNPVVPFVAPARCASAADCLAAGREHERTNDPAGALTAYGRGCARGGATACLNAGRTALDGRADEPDRAKATAYFQRGCELGDRGACTVQTTLELQDTAREAAVLVLGCRASHARSCYELGTAYRNGTGVATDLPRAAAAFASGCELDHGAACDALALSHLLGEGVREDASRAVVLFEKACATTHGPTCFNLGVLFDEGTVVKRDFTRARDLYERACANDDLRGCNNLGSLHERGAGVPKDPAKARALWTQACERGFEHSCKNLERP